MAVRQSNLANVYSYLGQYEKARDLLEAALKSDEKNFGTFEKFTRASKSGQCQNNLAFGQYKNMGEDEKNFGQSYRGQMPK